VSDATISVWKEQCAHLGASELPRLRQVEEENNRLKRFVADLSLSAVWSGVLVSAQPPIRDLWLMPGRGLATLRILVWLRRETRQVDYNHRRSHSSLGYLTSNESPAQRQNQRHKGVGRLTRCPQKLGEGHSLCQEKTRSGCSTRSRSMLPVTSP